MGKGQTRKIWLYDEAGFGTYSSDYNGFGGRLCRRAVMWYSLGFQPQVSDNNILRPEGARDVKQMGLTIPAPSGRDHHYITDLWLKPQAILPNLFEVKNDNLPMCDYSPPKSVIISKFHIARLPLLAKLQQSQAIQEMPGRWFGLCIRLLKRKIYPGIG